MSIILSIIFICAFELLFYQFQNAHMTISSGFTPVGWCGYVPIMSVAAITFTSGMGLIAIVASLSTQMALVLAFSAAMAGIVSAHLVWNLLLRSKL